MSHEQSETDQDEQGQWRNYYGPGPAKGLRLPLDTSSYATVDEAVQAARIRSDMFPAAAEPDLSLGLQTGGFADLASSADLPALRLKNEQEMATAKAERDKARAAERAQMETGAAALKPQVSAVESAMGQREQLAQGRPEPLALPPPPSKKLTDFLAPVQGEQPENTITKLIQGVGLLASGFTGLRRGNATTALAAMAGALKGWNEGDKERADRAFGDWKAATDKMIAEHRDLVQSYQAIMDDADTNVAQKMELLKLKGLEAGHDLAVKTFDRQNLDEDVKEIAQYRDHLDKLQEHRDRLVAMEHEKRQHEAFILELQKGRAAQKAADDQKALDSLDKDTLRRLGKDYMLTGKMPSIGQGGKGQALMVRNLIVKEGLAWARENGLDPMQFDMIRAEVAAKRGELITLARNNGAQEAALARLEPHIATLIRLSDMVPRSEIPAVNGAIIRGEKEYKGSPEAAEYVAQAVEVAMEQARVQVPGTAQGDANSREEVRKTVSPSLSPNQIKAVGNRYIQNGHQSLKANRAKETELASWIDTLGGRIQGPPTPPPPGSTDPNDPLGILAKPEKK
jgi:hypothetical protein